MSESFVGDRKDAPLPLTGERTVPGIPEENYWFRRHEVVYRDLLARCVDRTVLEAGSGEGYGANMIAGVARHVTGLDYDITAVEHVRARYPRVEMLHGNLAELPLGDASVETIVNFQVIEHLWDQAQFLRECFRVLSPGGELLVSTPNRITFSPGRDTPLNPFHTRELDAAELTDLLEKAGFTVSLMAGVHHGDRLKALDAKYGGSFINAQIERALAGQPWPEDLARDVEGIATEDFVLQESTIDDSLDLVAVAVKDPIR
ncbi:class I SAM-dependent methyltransferase [Rhodococcus sp. (in: high G+C Gram-positive bacteria)]|uniref:class I SAM-dependent methyltransferase n=1 Tax=Rhodococcus sp. TaxID=1831 RepID=UPI003BAEB2E6